MPCKDDIFNMHLIISTRNRTQEASQDIRDIAAIENLRISTRNRNTSYRPVCEVLIFAQQKHTCITEQATHICIELQVVLQVALSVRKCSPQQHRNTPTCIDSRCNSLTFAISLPVVNIALLLPSTYAIKSCHRARLNGQFCAPKSKCIHALPSA